MATAHEQTDRKITLRLATRHHEDLLDTGQAIKRHRTETAVIDRHFAPAENLQALLGQPFLDGRTTSRSLGFVGVQEDLADSKKITRLLTKRCLGGFFQKAIRALDQKATTIAGLSVCSDTTSVGHAGQRLDGSLQQLVAGLALHVGNQTESAVVPEFIGMIQTCHHKRSLA